jgi:DNA replication protein DnaC
MEDTAFALPATPKQIAYARSLALKSQTLLLELFEERYQRRSTIITAQLPVSGWHQMIGEPTIADAILDRIIHNAHRIDLKGDSMRRKSLTPGIDPG